MTEDNKYSPGKLYEFNPDDKITPENVVELCNVIRIGVGGHVLKEMSEELQNYFKEVA
jgi:hypothetical protein